jgi:dephospho-CoA kinase
VPFLLGLTGNIACGKTAVGQLLAERFGAEYIDADRLVHGLYAADTPETWAIAQRFGGHLLGSDGTIDRRRLGDLVLADPAALRDLEAIVHPAVLRAVEQRVAASRAPVVVVDAIKLIESGLAARCQAVWVVTCDRADQLRRLQQTRGLTRDQAEQRIRAQGAQEEKLRHATAVIENRGSLEELARQVDAAWGRTVAPRLVP